MTVKPRYTTDDRAFNCAVVYSTPSGRRVQANLRTIAPAADLALDLAVQIVRTDKRRLIQSIEYMEAIEQ